MYHFRRSFLFYAAFFASALVVMAQPDSSPVPRNAAGVELIDIGGRKLQFMSHGHGSPAVIIEAGMGEPPIESGSWKTVIEEISKTHRICIYDRAGLGKSDSASKLPRTSLDVAEDLNTLLIRAGVSGPHVLVGHSYGGMHIRVFASRFPEKVAGMVLVDASHPDQDEKWLESLGPVLANEPADVQKARRFLTQRTSPASNPESIDPKTSSAQVRAARGLGDKPLVILTHSPKWRMDPKLPVDVGLKLEQVSQQLQSDLKQISTKSSLQKAEHAGHNVQVEEPLFVIKGIRQVLEAVGKKVK